MDISEIKKHWTDQAIKHGADPAASWSDVYAIELEISRISRRLSDGDIVVDLGCSNGYSTIQYALRSRIDILGIDYIPEMIASATERLAKHSGKIRGNVEFRVGDVAALDGYRGFDKAIMTRVLINLGDWNNQANALRKIANMLKPGGLLLMSEATRGGLGPSQQVSRRIWIRASPSASIQQLY